MTTVRFNGVDYDGNMTVEEFAAKLGRDTGFRIQGEAFKRNVALETYNPVTELSAQEIIESC